MKKILLTGLSLCLIASSFAQTQIGNSGFETWENVSTGQEPINWNSFLTASGSLNGQGADQLEVLSETRPGSTGTKSVKVKSRSVNLVVYTIVANGNLTLGRVNMGNISPTNGANHNYTVQGDSFFSESLTDKPDSIVFWAKYSSASSSSNARMKATLHDNYNYKDPEDAVSSTHVVATAVLNYPSNGGGWNRYSVPFVYSGPATNNTYILLTFTSNSTPGGGNGNDYVIIDDVELKYNQAPVANNDTYSGDENLDIICNVLSNDTDPENNINTGSVTIVTPPTNGSVVVSGTGVITYTPNLNYFGSDSFVYKFCDFGNQVECSNNATVSITVNAVNQAVTANPDLYFTPLNTDVVCNVLANDTDVENEINISSITVTQQPTNGTLLVNSTTGVITYTPDNGFLGTDSYIYEICDAGNPAPVYCDTALVTVNVFDPMNNQPMISNDDSYTSVQGYDVVCDVLANDIDPEGQIDESSLEVIVQPTNGTVVVDNGQIIYTPGSGFAGVDSYEYKVCDLGSPTLCDSAVVNLTITLNLSVSQTSLSDVEIKMVGNSIHFKGLENNSGTYYVYDLIGQLVQKGKISSQVAFTQKSGVYLITIESNLGAKTKRVFKN